MRNELIKVIRINDQESCWNSDAKDYTILSFKLERDECDNIGKVSFEKITGPDPYYRSIMNLFVYDSDLLNSVKEYVINFKRTNSFIVDVKEGISGCREATLFTSRNKMSMSRNRKRATLRISCNDKIYPESINEIWIGDLVELFLKLEPEFLNDLKFYLVNSNKGLQRYNRKYDMKYLKPIIPDIKVSLDDILDSEEIKENPEFKLFGDNGTKYLYNDHILKEQCHLEKMIYLYEITNKDGSQEYFLKIGSKWYETCKSRLVKVTWDKDKIKRARNIKLDENNFIEYDKNHCMQIKFNEDRVDINFYLTYKHYLDSGIVSILSVWSLNKYGKLTREDESMYSIHLCNRKEYEEMLYKELKEQTDLAD